MAKHIIVLWCTLLTISLYSMDSNKQIIPKNSSSSASLTTMPEDVFISIIAYSMCKPDKNEQENTSKTQRIMQLIRSIMSLRQISKTIAHIINPTNVILIIRELPCATNLLAEQPSFALPLYLAARDNKAWCIQIIMQLYPNNMIRSREVNQVFANRDNRTPALIAAHRGNIAAMIPMLPYVNFALRDIFGKNALMLAAHGESWRMMQLLLANGANTTEIDNIHRTIRVYTQTRETRQTLDQYEAINETLIPFPRALIALIFSYLIAPQPARALRCRL